MLSLKISVAAGLTNVIFDFLFIIVFHWGLAGAAVATVMGQFVGGILPLIYFLRPNTSLLWLTKTAFYGKTLLQTCINGSSEMVTNLSASIVRILFNVQLMRTAGENGVAACGSIMYVNFVFMGGFVGYSLGGAPIISYHFGAENHAEPRIMIFASYDVELFNTTRHGFVIYSLVFLLMGFNVWASAFLQR